MELKKGNHGWRFVGGVQFSWTIMDLNFPLYFVSYFLNVVLHAFLLEFFKRFSLHFRHFPWHAMLNSLLPG